MMRGWRAVGQLGLDLGGERAGRRAAPAPSARRPPAPRRSRPARPASRAAGGAAGRPRSSRRPGRRPPAAGSTAVWLTLAKALRIARRGQEVEAAADAHGEGVEQGRVDALGRGRGVGQHACWPSRRGRRRPRRRRGSGRPAPPRSPGVRRGQRGGELDGDGGGAAAADRADHRPALRVAARATARRRRPIRAAAAQRARSAVEVGASSTSERGSFISARTSAVGRWAPTSEAGGCGAVWRRARRSAGRAGSGRRLGVDQHQVRPRVAGWPARPGDRPRRSRTRAGRAPPRRPARGAGRRRGRDVR